MNYSELSQVMYVAIYERFLNNERLLRLLTCYDSATSPYTDITYTSFIESIGGVNNLVYRNQRLEDCKNIRIYPQPHIPDAKSDQGAYLSCSFNGGYNIEENVAFRNVVFNIDIIVHDEQNVILSDSEDFQIGERLYDILHEVTSVLNNMPLIGTLGRWVLVGFQGRIYNEYFHGVQVQYKFQVASTIGCNLSTPKSREARVR